MSFFVIDSEITDRTDLNIYEKFVLALVTSMQGKKEFAWPSQAKLAQMLSTSPRTIIRTIDSLEAKGFLEVKRYGKGRTNRYKSMCHTVTSRSDSQSPSSDSQSPIKVTDSHFLVIDHRTDHQPTSENGSVGGLSWLENLRAHFEDDKDYMWTDEKDLHALTELKKYVINHDITRDQLNDYLTPLWDEYLEKKNIVSIPAVLLHRLKQRYD